MVVYHGSDTIVDSREYWKQTDHLILVADFM